MKNDETIKRGDVVMLKSGGPPMTVGDVGPTEEDASGAALTEGEAVCAWFGECPGMASKAYTIDANRGVFHVDMLKKVEVA